MEKLPTEPEGIENQFAVERGCVRVPSHAAEQINSALSANDMANRPIIMLWL